MHSAMNFESGVADWPYAYGRGSYTYGGTFLGYTCLYAPCVVVILYSLVRCVWYAHGKGIRVWAKDIFALLRVWLVHVDRGEGPYAYETMLYAYGQQRCILLHFGAILTSLGNCMNCNNFGEQC